MYYIRKRWRVAKLKKKDKTFGVLWTHGLDPTQHPLHFDLSCTPAGFVPASYSTVVLWHKKHPLKHSEAFVVRPSTIEVVIAITTDCNEAIAAIHWVIPSKHCRLTLISSGKTAKITSQSSAQWRQSTKRSCVTDIVLTSFGSAFIFLKTEVKFKVESCIVLFYWYFSNSLFWAVWVCLNQLWLTVAKQRWSADSDSHADAYLMNKCVSYHIFWTQLKPVR